MRPCGGSRIVQHTRGKSFLIVIYGNGADQCVNQGNILREILLELFNNKQEALPRSCKQLIKKLCYLKFHHSTLAKVYLATTKNLYMFPREVNSAIFKFIRRSKRVKRYTTDFSCLSKRALIFKIQTKCVNEKKASREPAARIISANFFFPRPRRRFSVKKKK